MTGWREKLILGVDTGTQVAGVAAIRGDRLLWSTQLVLKPTGSGTMALAARLEMLRDLVNKIIIRVHPLVLSVEAPIQWETGRSREGKSTVGAGYGLILSLGAVHGLKTVAPNPTSVKRCMTGNPRADKPAMVRAARQRYSLTTDLTEDEADAAGICLAAQEILQKEEMAVQQSLFMSTVKKGRPRR